MQALILFWTGTLPDIICVRPQHTRVLPGSACRGSYLVLVQLTVLVLLLPLLLEGDDDETHEDVHHEEGDDDDVDDEEDGDLHAVVVDGAPVYGVGVHRLVEKSGRGEAQNMNLQSPL